MEVPNDVLRNGSAFSFFFDGKVNLKRHSCTINYSNSSFISSSSFSRVMCLSILYCSMVTMIVDRMSLTSLHLLILSHTSNSATNYHWLICYAPCLCLVPVLSQFSSSNDHIHTSAKAGHEYIHVHTHAQHTFPATSYRLFACTHTNIHTYMYATQTYTHTCMQHKHTTAVYIIIIIIDKLLIHTTLFVLAWPLSTKSYREQVSQSSIYSHGKCLRVGTTQ